MPEIHLFPEAIKLMRLRHRLTAYLTKNGLEPVHNKEAYDLIDEMLELEMKLYEQKPIEFICSQRKRRMS